MTQEQSVDPSQSLPWVEKYRPKTMDDIVAQDEIVQTLTSLMESNRLPHLLFYGPPGTGKTGMNPNHVKQNASDDRGIAVVREQIRSFASTKILFSSGPKLIILDEADQMTNDAQAALRRLIEKYTNNARFCIICNYVNKISPALQSRCTRFRFAPLAKEQVKSKILQVVQAENVNLTEDGLESLLKLGEGDMRKYLNILQATAMAFPVVNTDSLYATTGLPLPSDIKAAAEWLLNEDLATSIQKKNNSLADLVTALHYLVVQISLPERAKAVLIQQLAQIEYRLSLGASDELQQGALVSAFLLARESPN